MTALTKLRATCNAGVTFTPDQVNIDAESISVWCDFPSCPSRGTVGCSCPPGEAGIAVFIHFKKGD